MTASSHDVAGTYRTVLSGTYHAIHEFKVSVSPGRAVDTTIHWFFATGRSNPVYAITQDASDAGINGVIADARSPYGSLTFDGMSTGNVAGIGWGEWYRFGTTGPGPLTINSPWDYSQTNVVPHVLLWSSAGHGANGAA